MKLIKNALFVGLLAIASQPLASSAFADGGDSSAGGGGGSISLSSGFTAGKFDLSHFSGKTEFLATVLKYYVASGAVRHENSSMIWYEVAGEEADHAMIEKKNAQPGDDSREDLQLNNRFAYEDLILYRAGCGTMCMASIAFRGKLADRLYAGMLASGLEPAGYHTDPRDPQHVTGYIFTDGALHCDAGGLMGTNCSFNVTLALPPAR